MSTTIIVNGREVEIDEPEHTLLVDGQEVEIDEDDPPVIERGSRSARRAFDRDEPRAAPSPTRTEPRWTPDSHRSRTLAAFRQMKRGTP